MRAVRRRQLALGRRALRPLPRWEALMAERALEFVGRRISDVARDLGMTEVAARDHFYHRGYRAPRGVLLKLDTAVETEDAIISRLNARGPVDPCWRCGAARGCVHRENIITNGERPC